MNAARLKPAPRAARGTVYLIVLSTVALATTIGIAGVLVAQSQRRAAQARFQAAIARANAMSAVEFGLQIAQNTAAWRASIQPDGIALNRASSSGNMKLTVTDPADSNLTNSLSDLVTLTGEGTFGTSLQMVRVKLTPSATPLDSLTPGVTVNGTISFSGSGTTYIRADGGIQSNTSISSATVTIVSPVSAVGAITGTGYSVGSTTPVRARQMPTASSVLAIYAAMATTIPYGSISGNKIDKVLLSPNSNPWGANNAAGVYLINCNNNTIEISKSRVLGTLILVNPKSDSKFEGPCLLESLSQDAPALIVVGNWPFDLGTGTLSELSLSTNFNPTGSAYRGQANALALDSYPTLINGIVYVTGNATISSALTIEGTLLVGGNLSVTAPMTVRHVPVVKAPIGFGVGAGFTAGSTDWSQAVN